MRHKLTKDQKRKKKLKERARAERGLVQPYCGRKYRNAAYVPLLLATESAINIANVMCKGGLSDRNVVDSLTYLVHKLRGEHPELPPDNPCISNQSVEKEDLIAYRIQEDWKLYFLSHPPVAKSDLIGVLRTILDSIDIWSARGGYLKYLEGFLGKVGMGVRRVSEEELNGMLERGELAFLEEQDFDRG